MIDLENKLITEYIPLMNYGDRLVFEFSEPVYFRGFSKYKQIFGKVFEKNGKVFVNQRIDSSNGFKITDVISNPDIILNITIKYKNKLTPEKTIEKILNYRYDELTWKSLGTIDEPTKLLLGLINKDGNAKFTNISTVINKSNMEMIENSFKNKKSIQINIETHQRIYKINTRWSSERQEFLAWFSSTYINGEVGNYYILLNPKNAVLGEQVL
jgi:hypothetical protein